jgi:hypothetical protein
MRVSHETIYRSLYVQGRGGLRRELVKCLRTGRALRKTRRSAERRGRIAGMVSIAQRPPEALDRAVPRHWEGDLITGAENKSAIGTLVERSTGYVMLLHLPNSHGADDVQDAMVEAMSRLPQTLRRTLTWDQGQEMATMRLSRKPPSSKSTSVIRTHAGSGRRMRTRMGCCANTFRKAPTCLATTATTSSSSPRNSTTGHANGSAGAPQPRHSTSYSQPTTIHPMLR